MTQVGPDGNTQKSANQLIPHFDIATFQFGKLSNQ